MDLIKGKVYRLVYAKGVYIFRYRCMNDDHVTINSYGYLHNNRYNVNSRRFINFDSGTISDGSEADIAELVSYEVKNEDFEGVLNDTYEIF